MIRKLSFLSAAIVLALVAVAFADSTPPAVTPTDSPTIEARGHGGHGRGILKRFKERRQRGCA